MDKVMNDTKSQGVERQFYIIVGVGKYEFKQPNDGNIYINATGVQDVNFILHRIATEWQLANKNHIPINGKEVVFLIPDEKYRTSAMELMSKLKVTGGKIQLMASSTIINTPEPLQNNIVDYSKNLRLEESNEETFTINSEENLMNTSKVQNETIANENTLSNQLVDNQPKVKETEEKSENGTVSSKVSPFSYHKENNNNFRDIDLPIASGGTARSGSTSQGQDSVIYPGYNPSLINSHVKSLVKKPMKSTGKSAAFIHLPVIVFILSALLLIASIILLFVME